MGAGPVSKHIHGTFAPGSQGPDKAVDTGAGRQRPEVRRAFARLNLAPSSTLAEIKRRYKELVKRHHPDLNGGDTRGEERLKEFNEAYSTLLACDS